MSADSVAHQDAAAGTPKRRLLSPAGDPLVRAVGRIPAGVHAKLLVAFVGTALLVVVVAVLGLRLLGQSNERVDSLGTLQARAAAYGKLRSDTSQLRGLLAQRVQGDFGDKVFPELNKDEAGKGAVLVDQAILSAASCFRLPPSTTALDFARRPRTSAR